MTVRAKTRKRLLIGLLVAIVLATLGTAGYFLRDRQLEARSLASREEGLALLNGKDYEPAMHALGTYLRRHPDDADVLFQYGFARQRVPQENGRHLADAMELYRRVLSLQPSHTAAAQELLELYTAVGFNTEAIEFSGRLLQSDPEHAAALRARAVAALRMRQFDVAEDAAMRLSRAAPHDPQGHLLVLEVLSNLEDRKARLKAWAQTLPSELDEGVALLLQSIASRLSGELDQSKALALRAAEQEGLPQPLALRLADELELHGEPDRALEALQRAHSGGRENAQIEHRLAARLWQLGRREELAAVAAKSNQPAVRALWAMCLMETGRPEEGRAALASIKTAGDAQASRLAAAWGRLLDAAFAEGAGDAVELYKAARTAVELDPGDPHLRLMLGDALDRLGERDSAIPEWRQAMSLSRGWHLPCHRLTRAALAARRLKEASILADEGLRRAPADNEALFLRAVVSVASLDYSDPAQVRAAFEQIEQVDRATGSPETALPLRVRLLCGQDRDAEAADIARDYAASSQTREATLLQLASASISEQLGIEQELLDAAVRNHGSTSAVLAAQARLLNARGRTAEALQLFEEAQANVEDAAPRVEMQWARAEFLEETAAPGAANAWIALADTNPDNAGLQLAALSAASVQRDLTFQQRVIGRLQQLTGEQSHAWRLARARLLLRLDEGAGGKDRTVEAALVLNELVRDIPEFASARLLLAEALRRLNNEQGALEQLTAAAALIPESADVALALGRLHQKRGDISRAQEQYSRVIGSSQSAPQQRDAAVAMLASIGDAPAALASIEARAREAGTSPEPTPLLATLFARTGQMERAQTTAVLLSASATPEDVSFAARFFAITGNTDAAGAALTRLERMSASPSLVARTRGQCAASAGDLERALEHFEQATAAAPAEAEGWRLRLKTLIQAGQTVECHNVLNQAQRSAKDSGIDAFAACFAPSVLIADDWPEAVYLAASVLDAPESSAAVQKALAALASANNDLKGLVAQLRPLAASTPGLLALQILCGDVAMRAGEAAEAAQIGAQAMQSFPGEPAAARLTVMALAKGARWTELLAASQEWKRRDPADALPADRMIAEAHDKLGNTSAARAVLEAHVTTIEGNPVRHGGALSQLAILRARDGDVAGAVGLLRPSLAKVEEVRLTWLKLAATLVDLEQSEAMLREAHPLMDPSVVEQQLTLARAWHDLGRRTSRPEHYDLARQIAIQVASSANGRDSVQAQLVAASLFGSLDEPAYAETCYRRVLELAPEYPGAQNNLALLLVRRPDGLDEALRLALQAARHETDQHIASYLETLAQVHTARGERQEALSALQRAVSLRPMHAASRVALAERLTDENRLQEAAEQLESLEGLGAGELSAALRERLDQLRQRFSAAG